MAKNFEIMPNGVGEPQTLFDLESCDSDGWSEAVRANRYEFKPRLIKAIKD